MRPRPTGRTSISLAAHVLTGEQPVIVDVAVTGEIDFRVMSSPSPGIGYLNGDEKFRLDSKFPHELVRYFPAKTLRECDNAGCQPQLGVSRCRKPASHRCIMTMEITASRTVHDLSCAQAAAFAEVLLDELNGDQIARALERFELICEQRGWEHPKFH